MTRKNSIKLLLINESDNESERIISLFRNAGRVARAFRPDSAEKFKSMLDNESWDLLIANDKHPEIDVIQCLEQLQKMPHPVPSIVLRETDVEPAFEAGACDVINSNDDKRLIFAAYRELRNLHHYKQLGSTLVKLADVEERCKLLMSESNDAIAYLADGMLINCNNLFCSIFGYEETDDLDCAPIIDLIDAEDHSKFKTLLKKQNSSESSTDFKFTGIKQSHETFSAQMQLTNSVFDDEPCIQLTIKEQAFGSAENTSGNITPGSSSALHNRDYFLSQLKTSSELANSSSDQAALFYIGIDKFNDIRSNHGLYLSHHILEKIADFIESQSDSDAHNLVQFCDDSFVMLLQKTDTEAGKTYAENIRQALEKNIIEIEGQSIQCTVSIGIVIIDGSQSQVNAKLLIEQAFNTCEKIREDSDGNGIAMHVPVQEKKSLGNAVSDEELDNFLQESIEEGNFALTYQPVVSLRGSDGDHYEVRTTMKNEHGEILDANDFLNNISFKEFNTRLDRWVLLEATKKLSVEIENGNNTLLLINLTANALQDPSLITWLSVALKAGGIPPESLIFQFSENDIVNYLKPAKVFSEAVKTLGCKLSISNFGDSNNPIKGLQHVNADYAKIANKFTTQLAADGDGQILKSLVSSINENEAQAIICGVENASALAQLWQIGVDYIQGGYLAGATNSMDYEFTDIA